MKKATITTVLQGCKGPQGRTRLAVLIGGVAMLLLLLSELMPTEVCCRQHSATGNRRVSDPAGKPA